MLLLLKVLTSNLQSEVTDIFDVLVKDVRGKCGCLSQLMFFFSGKDV